MRSSLSLLALLLSSSVAFAKLPVIPPPARWIPPSPTSSLTASGVRVIVLPEHTLPVVHILATVQAGSELDPPDKPGLACATARFLEEGGAGPRSASEVVEALDDLGDGLRIDCDESGVRISMSVLAARLPPTLQLIGDLLARPRFDTAEWPSARARQVAEIVRKADEPREVATDVFARVLYGQHPYGHSPLGTIASLGKLTLDDVRAFHAAHYGPKTSAVLLSGDVSVEQASQTVQSVLARWTSKAAPQPAPALASRPAPRVVLVDRPGAPQSQVRVGHVGVSWATPDFAALSLLETVLGGSFTSRLNQNLREKHGYTYGARAEFKLLREAGPFDAHAAVRTDVTAESVQEILAELGAIRAPLTDGELKKGRALVLQSVVEAFGDGPQALNLLAELVLHDRPVDTFTRLRVAMEALDVPSLQKVAARAFSPELSIVIVGDRKLIEPKLRALPFAKSLEIVNVDGDLMK